MAISCVVWKNGVRRWEYLEMETCKLIIIFFCCRCNAAHGSSYLYADICPRILFLDTCLVCMSFTCLTCVWQVTWTLLSLSDSEASIFLELGHSMNWTQKKEKKYINNKTICSGYSGHSLNWGSNVSFFIGIFSAFFNGCLKQEFLALRTCNWIRNPNRCCLHVHLNVINDRILQISLQCQDCHLPGNGRFTAVCSI